MDRHAAKLRLNRQLSQISQLIPSASFKLTVSPSSPWPQWTSMSLNTWWQPAMLQLRLYPLPPTSRTVSAAAWILRNWHFSIDRFCDRKTVVNSGDSQANLLQLIQSLGEYLTNDDGFIRAKGRATWYSDLYRYWKYCWQMISFSATGLLSHVLSDTNQSSINAAAGTLLHSNMIWFI